MRPQGFIKALQERRSRKADGEGLIECNLPRFRLTKDVRQGLLSLSSQGAASWTLLCHGAVDGEAGKQPDSDAHTYKHARALARRGKGEGEARLLAAPISRSQISPCDAEGA